MKYELGIGSSGKRQADHICQGRHQFESRFVSQASVFRSLLGDVARIEDPELLTELGSGRQVGRC